MTTASATAPGDYALVPDPETESLRGIKVAPGELVDVTLTVTDARTFNPLDEPFGAPVEVGGNIIVISKSVVPTSSFTSGGTFSDTYQIPFGSDLTVVYTVQAEPIADMFGTLTSAGLSINAYGPPDGSGYGPTITATFVVDFSVTTRIAPLRYRQRDDGVRQRSARSTPSSKQASTRQGWRNTYL